MVDRGRYAQFLGIDGNHFFEEKMMNLINKISCHYIVHIYFFQNRAKNRRPGAPGMDKPQNVPDMADVLKGLGKVKLKSVERYKFNYDHMKGDCHIHGSQECVKKNCFEKVPKPSHPK